VASAWDDPGMSTARDELAAIAQLALATAGDNVSEARASAHNFFACIALASFEGFAPHLPQVVPPAVDVLLAADGGETSVAGGRRAVRTGAQEERVAALEALGAYAAAVGAGFAPHLPAALPAVCSQAQHASPQVRAAIARALGRICRSLGELAGALPESSSDRAAARSMAEAAVHALISIIEARSGDGGSATLRSALQTKEDLIENADFVKLAGQDATNAIQRAGGGRRSEDVESSDGEEVEDDDDDLNDTDGAY